MNEPGPVPAWKDYLPAITLALTVLGTLLTFGGYISQVQDDHKRIAALEQARSSDLKDQEVDRSQRDGKLNTIDVRTARIEAKLEVMLPENGGRNR